MKKLLTIIIPAYNEEVALSSYLVKVVQHCQKNNYDLIVVNDGSKDETQKIIQDILQNTDYQSIKHKLNKGYGAAIKTGIGAAQTPYVITIDADGQHNLEDIDTLYAFLKAEDADMIVGSRQATKVQSYYRNMGKWLIRRLAKILLPMPIYDLNSGMKIYDTQLAQKYLTLCPNSMAYSDIIALIFISQRHLVLEHPIRIRERIAGTSTINTFTALETVKEILNIVMLFNPMRIFFPLSITFIGASLLWAMQFILLKNGLSVGALLGILVGILFFILGLLAEQLALIRKERLE